jgi:hypothetical protein
MCYHFIPSRASMSLEGQSKTLLLPYSALFNRAASCHSSSGYSLHRRRDESLRGRSYDDNDCKYYLYPCSIGFCADRRRK